jgi:hypothetical protein
MFGHFCVEMLDELSHVNDVLLLLTENAKAMTLLLESSSGTATELVNDAAALVPQSQNGQDSLQRYGEDDGLSIPCISVSPSSLSRAIIETSENGFRSSQALKTRLESLSRYGLSLVRDHQEDVQRYQSSKQRREVALEYLQRSAVGTSGRTTTIS